MNRPRLLDLFCCAGGAAKGYHDAGFDVVGVDINPQPRYPYKFIQADALDYATDHAYEYDVIHASPPCQAYSITRHTHDVEHPDLLNHTRQALEASGLPYVIENVPGAPLNNPLTLCGSEFGLTAPDIDGTTVQLRRHRLFESNIWLMGAGGCYHNTAIPVAGSYTGSRHTTPTDRDRERLGGYTPHVTVRAQLLGIDWMNPHELAQAIPPAYTEHIGRQLLDTIR